VEKPVGVVWRLLQTLRNLKRIFSFMLELLRIATLPSLLVGLYSFLVIYVMVLAAGYGLGFFVWGIPVAMLSPVVFAWFRILQKRYREYIVAIIGLVPFKWDIETAVETWSRIATETARPKEKRKSRSMLSP